MYEIWANKLLPKALKSCPKSNKSPNLVTLVAVNNWKIFFFTATDWDSRWLQQIHS